MAIRHVQSAVVEWVWFASGVDAARRRKEHGMRFLVPFAVAMTIVGAGQAGRSFAVEPQPAAADRISRLIADLGSDDFIARESASEELAKIGLPAFAALELAASHPDREVRFRSQRVLNMIRQHDQERRIDAFLSGRDEAEAYPLPGWTRFRKSYGDDSQSRRLFIELHRADPELLKAIDDSPRRATEVLIQRAAQVQQALQQGMQQISVGQFAAALFIAAEDDVSLPGDVLQLLFTQCFQPTIREIIGTHSRGGIPRKMLGALVARSDDRAAYAAMGVANQFKLPEGVVPAERVLKNYDAGRVALSNLVQNALMTVAQLGDVSHLPLVDTDKLMHDTTAVAQFQENGTTYVIQLRDVALAAAVMLTRQDVRTYFNIPAGQLLAEPQMIFYNARLIGFPSDEKRAAVFEKWAKYKATR
jgi:hypothetical protein